jgi:hypothetical protein
MSESEARRMMSAATFARECLGFEPDAKQAEALDCGAKQVIINCSRQWGKSTVTAAKAVHVAHTRPESLVIVASRAERQSNEFLRKAQSFVRRLGLPVKGDGKNRVSIALPNGSRIVGLPGRADTTVGFSAVSLLIFDEAALVKDDLYYELWPMLTVSDGDLWLLSTPAGRRGFFYNEWMKGGDEWFRVSVPATECPRISPEFLERVRKRLPEERFRQSYMCEFAGVPGALFREEDVLACLRDDIEPLIVL